MSEKIIVRQNKDFQIGFWAADPQKPDSNDDRPVHGLHEITPYGMMLISLASCTAQVVLIYAQHHNVKLDEVELRMSYERVYQEDCEGCEDIDRYDEKIHEQISFSGELSDEEKEKLFQVAHHCPIEKMFKSGIEVQSELVLTQEASHGIRPVS